MDVVLCGGPWWLARLGAPVKGLVVVAEGSVVRVSWEKLWNMSELGASEQSWASLCFRVAFGMERSSPNSNVGSVGPDVPEQVSPTAV